MARLVIVTTPELENGYKLAGGAVMSATTPQDAEQHVRKLIADGDVAVIGVHGPLFGGFGASFLREVAARTLPVVIEIPGDTGSGQTGPRARIIDLLRHAIGLRIAFGEDASR